MGLLALLQDAASLVLMEGLKLLEGRQLGARRSCGHTRALSAFDPRSRALNVPFTMRNGLLDVVKLIWPHSLAPTARADFGPF
jgi:hypothetical protein